MATVRAEVRIDRIVEKWHALARRRLAYMRELERSGRWKHYCTQEQLVSQLHEAERVAEIWAALAGGASGLAPRTDLRSPRNSVSRGLPIDTGAIIAYLKSVQQR